MSHPFKSLAKISSIDSVSKVIATLIQLDSELAGTALLNLKVFNHAYLIITKNVYTEMQRGNFVYGDILQQLDVHFAKYYFNAIKDYENGDEVPKAWDIALTFYKERKSYQLFYLMLAANAHIQNDLPFSLQHLVKNENFLSDYQKVGEIINASLPEIMRSINNTPFWFSDLVIKIYIRHMMKKWRMAAWGNFVKLKKNDITKEEVENNALESANKIVAFAKMIP